MRDSHPDLCNIPRITVDSDIVEQLEESHRPEPPKTSCRVFEPKDDNNEAMQSPLSEPNAANTECRPTVYDETHRSRALEEAIDDEADGEELESPPMEQHCPSTKKENKDDCGDSSSGPPDQYSSDSNCSADEAEYLRSIMEPICELRHADEVESEVFRNQLKLPTAAVTPTDGSNNDKEVVVLPRGPGRGRRREVDDLDLENRAEGFFQCTICEKSFQFAGDLAKHVRSHTLNKPYACSICDKSFTHIGSLNTHLRIHSGEKPYKCDRCEKAFTQSSSLMVHRRSHLSKKPHQCHVCDKGFVNSSSLMLHMKTHTATTEPPNCDDSAILHPFQCSDCGKRFKQSQVLAEHLIVHTEPNLYQCSICRKQFPASSDLVQHLKHHTGEKPFQCAICGKSFTQPGSLNTHTRIHTGVKPFQCVECDKTFTQASSLSVHMKVHGSHGNSGGGGGSGGVGTDAEKPFRCQLCDKTYTQQAYFNRHMVDHQHEQMVACPLCNMVTVSRPQKLMNHFNKYHYDKKDKLFLCSICEARFEDPQLLFKHVQIHFGEDLLESSGSSSSSSAGAAKPGQAPV